MAGANDVIGDPFTMVNVKIKIGSSRTNGIFFQANIRKKSSLDLKILPLKSIP